MHARECPKLRGIGPEDAARGGLQLPPTSWEARELFPPLPRLADVATPPRTTHNYVAQCGVSVRNMRTNVSIKSMSLRRREDENAPEKVKDRRYGT